MSSNKKPTKFQSLSNILMPSNRDRRSKNSYKVGREILKTNDKEEYLTQKKQYQQNHYNKVQWQRVENELYQSSLHYEASRIGSYNDFEQMEFYPEIASALELMMEESTTINDKGKIMNIYSESNRIKDVLEDLFFNRLDIATNLPMWVRNLCKYGDNFVYLNTDHISGIVGVKQLPVIEIERREGDLYGIKTNKDNGDNKVKFLWKRNDTIFQSFQMAHFRLLGDDRRLPYGTSVLEKSRRIWKQLLLSEDAMLVYRITRAPERRVYKVYVGNLDPNDVGQYVDDIANNFKRAPIHDPKTGQIDLKYNQMAVDQDIFIPVRDENAQTPIDTLPGAQNLDQIADIQYLQNKLFTSLRVPKTFLGFDEAAGEGKNLALQDIRFTRTINRIQQSIIQELNKIAIVHLYLLGFKEDLDNFKLTLNNPSTQAEMLKIENEQNKMNLYKEAVSDAGNGFGAMSMTRGKKEILGWSDDEIRQDILEQRMEKAAALELENTGNVIKHTGLYDKVDRIYGDINAAREGGQDGENNDEGGPTGAGGGGFGGGSSGLDFGDDGMSDDENLDDTGDSSGGDVNLDDVGGPDDTDSGDEIDDSGDFDGEIPESVKKMGNLLTETTRKKISKQNNIDLLANRLNKPKTPNILEQQTKIYDKSILFNNTLNDIMNQIDENIID